MRTIKFRGYNKKNGKWLFGSYILNRGHHFVAPDEFAESKTWEDYEVIEETIGQFTGLHDKNGNEIYEGDIVKFTNLNTYVGIVQWDLCNPCMCISYKNKYGYEDIEYDFIKAGNMLIEVIGNIHDNPELLER